MGIVVDQRSKTEVYDSGSSLLAILLSAADAISIFNDPSAVEGWYIPSFQETTQVGPDRDTETVRDEAGTRIKQRTSRDEFVIITVFFQTDDDLLNFMAFLENENNARRIRYPMPTQQASTVEQQWVFGHSATVRKEDWRIEAADDQDRKRSVTFVLAEDTLGNPVSTIVTLPASQVDAAWDAFSDFKDTASP